jgi:MFS family permease
LNPVRESSAALLRHRPFALYWFSRILSAVAFHMQAVAIGWQVYALTGSALDLGLIGLVQFAPMILLTLVVGHVADRYDRRVIVSLCRLVVAGAAATLALGTLGGWLSKATIFTIVALSGAARAFENPSTAALVPGLVPRAEIPRATAWTVSATQTAQIVGPALGGLLYGLGAHVVYGIAAALLLLASVLVALVRIDRPVRAREPFTLESFLSGVLFIRNKPVLLGVMSLDLFAVLLGGATALLPIYARDILQTGPWGLGLLRSAPAIGALLMSVLLARYPLERRVGRTLFATIIVFGAATVVFGLSTHLVLSLAALSVLGAADVISMVIRFSLVQIRTPDAMRGRVSAVHSLFTGTSNQLGEFESGLTAALFGAVPAVLIGGLGTIAVATLWMCLFPDLRRIRALEG